MSASLNGFCLAFVCRAVCGLLMETTSPHPGLILSVPLGGLIALPAVLLLHKASSLNRLALPFTAQLILDSADIALRIAQSAWFISLDRVPVALLTLPLLPVLLLSAVHGQTVLGYAAAILSRLLIILGLVIVAAQLRSYRPAWLFPLLGEGLMDILAGALRIAGWAGLYALSLAGQQNFPIRRVICRYIWALGSATVIIALAQMMIPYTSRLSEPVWMNRLDALIANGRGALYLQMPVIVLWFSGLLYVLGFDAALASSLIERTGRKRGWAVLGAMLALLSAGLGLPENEVWNWINQWQWVPLCALLPIGILIKGGKSRAMD